MKFLAIITTALAALFTSGLAQAPEPLPADALKVIKLFTGKCDVTIDGAPELKGTATGVFTLGDRVVRDEFELKDGDGNVALLGTTIMAYDPAKKVYRMWTFLSTGVNTESEGTWNEATHTLTSTSRDAEKQHVTTWFSTFSAEGAETWGFVTKDKDGKVVEEVGGKSTARKSG